MNNDLDYNTIDNNDKNKTKEYNDTFTVKPKSKKSSTKIKKKKNVNNKSSNEQIDNNNNDNQEDIKLNAAIQDRSINKESIEDILNKTLTKKKLAPINIEKDNNNKYGNENENSNKEDNLIDNCSSTPNMNNTKYLRLQINEKMQQIEELSLSQDINKKILTDILQKLNHIIKSNAELLYSGIDPNEDNTNNKQDTKNKINKLYLIIETKKKELELSKEINKNYKNKYEYMFKQYNISSIDKIDNFQRKIDDMKNSNSALNKKIKLINYKNHLKGKKLDLNSKIKISNDIKKYSDEYTTLMKEKYNQFVKLNNNKKLIKDAVAQFQYLMKMLNEDENNNENKKENEKNYENNFINKIKNLKIEEDINNLKEDLSGNEENIYNKVITDKSIILLKYYKNINKNRPSSIINKRNNKSIKKIKLSIENLPKNIKNNNNKKLINSKSCNDVISQNKIKNNENNNNNLDFIDDINLNEINYDNLTNIEYEKINAKKQKYYNLDERLDKSLRDLSLLYEHKIKEINILLDINTKNLSNIQQENELLKSKIADLRRILELNKKEQKLLNQNMRYKNNNNLNEKKLSRNNVLDVKEEKFQISDIGKDITYTNKVDKSNKSEYIDMLKEKYKVKNKVLQEEVSINPNDFDADI